ncbi:hypothetical protein Scep_015015 [Stephania cephalantha]|uniref:Uncharacterized protein n=1 Tax=Stephania cephalantha TaxID=152367 RepID=A0AAP0J2D0_9MAGN
MPNSTGGMTAAQLTRSYHDGAACGSSSGVDDRPESNAAADGNDATAAETATSASTGNAKSAADDGRRRRWRRAGATCMASHWIAESAWWRRILSTAANGGRAELCQADNAAEEAAATIRQIATQRASNSEAASLSARMANGRLMAAKSAAGRQ